MNNTKSSQILHTGSLRSSSVSPAPVSPDQDQPDDEPDKLSNRVFQLDPGTDRWIERASMRFSRYRCGTAVLNREIYILGETSKVTTGKCRIRTPLRRLSTAQVGSAVKERTTDSPAAA